MTNLETFLAEVEGRLKQATPGKWGVSVNGQGVMVVGDRSIADEYVCESHSLSNGYPGKTRCWQNIALIAATPDYLAKLLEIVRVQAEALQCVACTIGLRAADYQSDYRKVQSEVNRILGGVE